MGLALPTSVERFRDSRKGETAWVLGSGASLDRVPRWFWSPEKLIVAVNFVGVRLGISEFYAVTHYHCDAAIIASERLAIIP